MVCLYPLSCSGICVFACVFFIEACPLLLQSDSIVPALQDLPRYGLFPASLSALPFMVPKDRDRS